MLALGLVAALAFAGACLLGSLVGRQERHAALINLAGAQRMLSQRIAALSSEVVAPGVPAKAAQMSLEALDAARLRMASAAARLTDGEFAPAYDTPQLEAAYFGGADAVAPSVADYLQLAWRFEQAVRARDLSAAGAAGAALRASALGPLLGKLQHAVELHEKVAAQELRDVTWTHRGLTAAALLLLLAEGVFIFWPLAQRVGELARRLEYEALADPLTGLLNRRSFNGRLQAVVESMHRGARPHGSADCVAVVVADLDWLKETNAAEGQAGGDALIQAAAVAMRSALRPSDLVARVGGDSFAAALVVADQAAAEAAAERLRDVLHKAVSVKGRMVRAGASLGVALSPADASDADDLLRMANDAMMTAKRSARGKVVSFAACDRDRLARQKMILRSLDGHLTGGLAGLCAHLQPQIRIADGSLVGLEALARWNHPELGWLSPAEFLPLAQEHGSFGLVGGHVRRSALKALAGLWAAGHPWGEPPRLALNFSHAELARGDVVGELEHDLLAFRLPPRAIEIEITEEVLLDRVSDETQARLIGLRASGARLALDDFGSGNAGLAQVLRLPLDALKIDRSFVREIGQDKRAEEVIRATILLAHGLELEVVAEGVETAAQLAHLQALGCEFSQGYLHGRAMTPSDLASWLRKRTPVAAHSPPGLAESRGDMAAMLS